MGKQSLQILIEELMSHRQRTRDIMKAIRKFIREYDIQDDINHIRSIPGIGFNTAITLYSELIDINRFPDLDHLASYVGLIPSVKGSGERDSDRGLTARHNTYLRYLLVEAAWMAVRIDPVMTLKFSELTRKLSKQNAIMRIAKKLLNRTKSVWKNNQAYEMGRIE
jgi:transposase